MCIVAAEEYLCDLLPGDVDFQLLKEELTKFYEAFIDAYTSEHYWDLYSIWESEQSDY